MNTIFFTYPRYALSQINADIIEKICFIVYCSPIRYRPIRFWYLLSETNMFIPIHIFARHPVVYPNTIDAETAKRYLDDIATQQNDVISMFTAPWLLGIRNTG